MPYTLSIDGETVAANAESHRVTCGPELTRYVPAPAKHGPRSVI